ncbi:MAG: hypothetical protein EOO52_08960 [Gammaproteobacteria bacterium]|nr:MAG: hypothetical protein EOO52_08960 [Gammaproteobacteria bacterium]
MALFCNLKKVIVIFSTALILLGCHGKSHDVSKQTSAADSPLKKAKPGASVKLVSAPIIFMNSNQQTPVDIEIETSETEGDLEIDFIPTPNINIISSESHHVVTISRYSRIKFPITLLAPSDGRFYLKMNFRFRNGESFSSQTLALIMQVGPETKKTLQFKKPENEKVISLPAEEKISSQ